MQTADSYCHGALCSIYANTASTGNILQTNNIDADSTIASIPIDAKYYKQIHV